MPEAVHFQYPLALALLLFVPAVFWLGKKRFVPTGYSSVGLIARCARPGWLQRNAVVIPGYGFMILAVLSVANLRYDVQFEKRYRESKWIMIVQDLSGSMNRPSGTDPNKTLGDVSLEAVEAFVGMRRPEDLIGLIAFSSHARLVAPPTFDRRILFERLALLRRETDSSIFREMTTGGATNASYAAWLALCTFFTLMPENKRPDVRDLQDLRRSLSGTASLRVDLPPSLSEPDLGGGMAIVLFTDGRIEAGGGAESVRKGLPNFVNVVRLLRKIDIRLHIIVVGDSVDPEIGRAMASDSHGSVSGRIFHMPRRFDGPTISAAYEAIHRLEPNRLLFETVRIQKETRRGFGIGAAACLAACAVLSRSRRFGRI